MTGCSLFSAEAGRGGEGGGEGGQILGKGGGAGENYLKVSVLSVQPNHNVFSLFAKVCNTTSGLKCVTLHPD